MADNEVSLATYHRLPQYLKALYEMRKEGRETVSSVALAEVLSLSPSIVKKDLSAAKVVDGKPKVGYVVSDLISDLEEFLGCNNVKDAVLVGAGKLGQARFRRGRRDNRQEHSRQEDTSHG